jgi:hypothetical protein
LITARSAASWRDFSPSIAALMIGPHPGFMVDHPRGARVRGYPVREVAERLGVSTRSICTWQKQFSRPAKVIKDVDAQADEIRRLKRDLARVTDLSRTRKPSPGGC